ncbi:polyprenyl synthetase family protein [Bacillus alkalicellulosilyticus]|uniref:polyprenyl synthetase family protein n=1 Tax=Alkalihalobacterium alkalicellulosilyticum TaxID=1912214 RepID=UPI0009968588|nr:polyprenyl synthetase family protein [Bacillus alkalicellulosilyticus]
MNSRDILFGKLSLIHFEMFPKEGIDIEAIAAAVEVLILAGDIFDDLMDGDNEHAPWIKINSSLALQIAIGFVVLSSKIINQFNGKAMQSHYYSTLLQSINGQYIDLTNDIVTEQNYINAIKLKSGSLIALACLTGACSASNEEKMIIEEYANNIGVVQQINNDIRAFLNWDKYQDVFQRKKSLPILYALTSKEFKNEPLSNYYNGHVDYEDIYQQREQIIDDLSSRGALQYAKVISEIHKQKAIKLMNQIDMNPALKNELLIFIM